MIDNITANIMKMYSHFQAFINRICINKSTLREINIHNLEISKSEKINK